MRFCQQIVPVLLALAAPFNALIAQKPGIKGSLEASASFFSGNTDQRVLFTKGGLSVADSAVQASGGISFGYADAARDTVPREVTKRTWLATLALDVRPYDTFSPFAFLNYEASFEKRILDRVGLGVGGKVVLVKSSESEVNVSLAMLAERLRPTRASADTATVSAARWSGRIRLLHSLGDRLKVSHTTYYQPKVRDVDSYTVNSMSELAYALRQSTSLTLSYQSMYDATARSRGALSNNDAQLLVGIKTTF